MTPSAMIDRLQQLTDAGQGDSPEATHLRDQAREAAHRAFMKIIAPDFQQPDGSYPDWIARHTTTLGKPWQEDQ